MLQKNRDVRTYGEQNPMSKLTRDKVRSIYLDGRTNREIAAEYGVAASLASLIRTRRIWANETSDLPAIPRRRSGPKVALTA